MRPWQVLTVVLCGVISHSYSQSTENELIPVDITFWKKELRLKKTQVVQVRLIHQSLYNSLRQVSTASCVEGHELQTLLQLWHTAILGTLTQKQKRKWAKLVEKQ